MKQIEFKTGTYVMEILDNHSFVGYIKSFRLRSLGYSYQTTTNIFKAKRWSNFIACQSFYYQFVTNRISWYEKSDCRSFKPKEIKLDIKLKRKIKLEKLNKFKPWWKH